MSCARAFAFDHIGLQMESLCLLFYLLTEVQCTARIFGRNYNYTLATGNGNISSFIAIRRAECVSQCGLFLDCCCTQYDNSTRNCTFARTDYFQLLPVSNGTTEEVGVDRMAFLLKTVLVRVQRVIPFNSGCTVVCIFELSLRA